MEALVLEQPGEIAFRSVPVPVPQPGEVLLKVEAATTCGTDLKAYLRGHPMIPMPGLFGHEYSGVVAAVGEGVERQVGDEIMGVHSAPCKTCDWCRRGQENLCDSNMATKALGAYAEFLRIPARIAKVHLFSKPPSLSYATAALLEPLACVAQGIDQIPLNPDSRYLVIGPGAIGLMFVASLRLLGAEQVTLAGRNRARLAIGEALGAKSVLIDDVAELQNHDVVIECTGSVNVWESSVDYARRGGMVVLFGGCPGGSRASFDTSRMHYDQISLVSPFHFGSAAVRRAREWLLDPRMDLSALISGTRHLTEGRATFEDLRLGKGLKYAFCP